MKQKSFFIGGIKGVFIRGILIVAATISGLLIGTFEARADEEIPMSAFADGNIYAHIMEIADTNGDGILMKSEIETVTKLEMVEKSISSLIGLELCVNLEYLNLEKNYILHDISPLANLPKLEYLNLSKTEVRDFSPLTTMPSIKELILITCGSDDFSVLKQVTTLEVFVITEGGFSDLSVLSGSAATLKKIDIGQTGVSDISYVVNFTALEEFDCYSNFNAFIQDVSYVSEVVTLKRLNLFNNALSVCPDLSKLVNLEYLDLSGNYFDEAKGIENLTKLNTLILAGNSISELPGISKFTELVTFDINGNQISELEDLSALTKLEKVDIANNKLKKVPDLSNSTNLSSLSMYMNYFNSAEVENAGSKLPSSITSVADWQNTTRINEQNPTTDDPVEDENREVIADEGDDVIISGDIDEDVFVSGTEQEDLTKYQDIIDEIHKIIDDIKDIKVYDIFMYKEDSSGVTIKVQPDDSVEVKIKLEPQDKQYQYFVFRQELDGSLTRLQSNVVNGYLYFKSEHFSIFTVIMTEIFGEGETTLNKETEDYTYDKEDLEDFDKDEKDTSDIVSDETSGDISETPDETGDNENDGNDEQKNDTQNGILLVLGIVVAGVFVFAVAYGAIYKIRNNKKIN